MIFVTAGGSETEPLRIAEDVKRQVAMAQRNCFEQ